MRMDRLPSTSCGLAIAWMTQALNPVLVSSTWAIRCPAAPSHSVMRASRFAGRQGATAVAAGAGVDAVAAGDSIAVGGATIAADGDGEASLPTPPGVGRMTKNNAVPSPTAIATPASTRENPNI